VRDAEGRGALYDLATDAREQRDVQAHHPAIAAALRQALDRHEATAVARSAGPEEVMRHEILRSLGYR
jgi:hypothetical protein